MYTINITFACEYSLYKEVLDYLRSYFINTVELQETEISLKKLVEADGMKISEEEGVNLALSLTFPSETKAKSRNTDTIVPALSIFFDRFGEHCLYFVTMLEEINIKE